MRESGQHETNTPTDKPSTHAPVVSLFAKNQAAPQQVGSGVVVSENQILTCQHVAELLDGKTLVVFSFEKELARCEIKTKLSQQGWDLALIELETSLECPAGRFISGINPGTWRDFPWEHQYAACGYPHGLGGKKQLRYHGFTFGLQSQEMNPNGESGPSASVQITGGLDSGCSGGAVMVETNQGWVVAGLVTMGSPSSNRQAATSAFIPADRVTDFLFCHGCDYAKMPLGDITSEDADFDKQVSKYRETAREKHAYMNVAGFRSVSKINIPVSLTELYVPLSASFDTRTIQASDQAMMVELSPRAHESEIPLARAFIQAELNQQRHLVILGHPGSGKTTQLKRMLLWCLQDGARVLGLKSGFQPVFLALGHFTDSARSLASFMASEINPGSHRVFDEAFCAKLLERKVLFLLDGLDEIADINTRVAARKWIEGAAEAYPECRFVVTCRYAGYAYTDVSLNERFMQLCIRPLDENQAERFVQNWFGIFSERMHPGSDNEPPIEPDKLAESFWQQISGPDFRARGVFAMTRNPLLLANLCLVYAKGRKLPKERVELYRDCTGVLLESWREAKGLEQTYDAQQCEAILRPVAYWMHEKEKRETATADELDPVVGPVLSRISNRRGWLQWFSRRTRAGEGLQFLRRHCEESGLLTSRGDDRFGFLHHGFQEFLAARHVEHERLLDVLAQRFGQSWWQEVILLLLGIGDQSLFESFMAKVLRLPGIVDQRELLGRCVSDAKATSIKPFIDFVRRGRERPDNQLVALETLAELDKEAVKRLRKELRGHPSQEIRIWFASRQVELAQKVAIDEPSGIELVLIPEGSFLMGSPDSEQGRFDWEGPVHEVTVSSFYLGKYPVTNAAYEKFLKANTNVQAPEYWGDDRYNQPNQPVVGVSWNEARKYCEWAGLRLPSEAEWEYACRAGTRTRYYTGDSQSDLDKAGWYYGNSGGRPHSVGEKEPNRFGLYDMHGNVCEWCEDDWHHSYEGAPVDGSAWVKNPRAEDRVSRGGSWGGVARDCRSAFRDGWGPGVRGGGLGFRPARSFP